MTDRAKGYYNRIRAILGEAAGNRALSRGEYRSILEEVPGDAAAALDALESDDEQEAGEE